jgi:hypothetical protein
MKRQDFTTAALLALALIPAGIAAAQGWCGGGPVWWNSNRYLPDNVRLRPDQQAEIDRIQSSFADRYTMLHQQFMQVSADLNRESARSQPAVAKLRELRLLRIQLVNGMRTLRYQMNRQIDRVLTADQRAYFHDYFNIVPGTIATRNPPPVGANTGSMSGGRPHESDTGPAECRNW